MHDQCHQQDEKTLQSKPHSINSPATLADVARRAEVAKSTVSRALSNDPNLNIREETRLRIKAAAAELSYMPNPNARSLRLSRSWTLAFVVSELDDPDFGQIIEGAHRAAVEHNYSMLIAQVEDGKAPHDFGRRIVVGSRVDGVLLGTVQDAKLVGDLASLGARVVMVDRELAADKGHSVVVDNEAGTALAVAHLAALGHRRIAYLSAHVTGDLADRRRSGFLAGLSEAALDDTVQTIRDIPPSAHDAEAVTLEILTGPNPVTAFIAWNLPIAAGIIRAANRLNLKVPQDVSVISLNDTRAADMMTPSITAVHLPLFRLGWSAATTLIDLIEGRNFEPKPVVLRPDGVITRESTGPVARA
ncbi:LacI family transcriptional regulator [Acuticoccus sp. M5D2P5]|uniref:LacI family DNA-binding transcriptional regulator n=1 Tax=Acuticoccus kalidii TaxID=2910977 RepID=UPI001F3AF4C0|nr:LacI family DNA-binding transcriptional regulator [Acuticoccus kalidii]MCF3936736.1 LacI family transcriptional regulator [Acuticoccus kalidii]